MGGTSQAVAAMAGQDGIKLPKASVPLGWILNTPDELDAPALMDLVMARAAVLAAMRMCAPESLPRAGERLAASMNVELPKNSQDLDEEPMVVSTSLPAKDQASKDEPVYVWPALTSELHWKDINSLREQRRELLLRGLPARLCSASSISKLLAAVETDHDVEIVKAQCAPGRRVGHAILRVKTAGDLKRVARFFHGWQCGNSMPIAVSFFSGHSKGLLGRKPALAPSPALRRTNSVPSLVRRAAAREEEVPDFSQSNWARRSTD